MGTRVKPEVLTRRSTGGTGQPSPPTNSTSWNGPSRRATIPTSTAGRN
ncbi:hypothetical protein A483_HHAL011710 [Halyomorpha halys]|nr:hypothetical protein A483_HHAL011710 [Halyomorpha halys]